MKQPRIIPVPADGAEDVLVDPDGNVWTGTVEGSIFRIKPDGSLVERIANTGGRP
ncbi:MAG: SMP-30/gluconolactonase/LRE family protein, partial [Myxococcales bacterium]